LIKSICSSTLGLKADGTALGYAAIISLGEFGASSFLANGSEATIPTLLYRLIARPGEQNYGMAMAVSAILIVLSALVVFLVSRVRKDQIQN
jgi:thiamine transport system permease protein